jgi:hypothetical protein
LGKCPSPRTEILKKFIPGLGTTADDQRRQHIRLDNDHRRMKVELARELIFEKGLAVKSDRVEALLAPSSYTPTRVCVFGSYQTLVPLTNVLLECFFPSALTIQLQFFFYVRSGSTA